MTPFYAVVSDVLTISPNFVRVTIDDLDAEHFRFVGYDQWFRLFLPLEGQERPVFPQPDPGQRLWEAYYAMPDDVRPVVRNYTVRRGWPDRNAIEVDFVVHGDDGPATRWARRVEPGAVVGILDQGAMFKPRDDADWFLFVADETGLPAVAGVLETMPADTRYLGFVETPLAADRQTVRWTEFGAIEWFHRDEPDAGRHVAAVDSEQLQKAVESAAFLDGRIQALVVGESSMVRAVRRHLVSGRGIAKDRVTFCGFWRHPGVPVSTEDDE